MKVNELLDSGSIASGSRIENSSDVLMEYQHWRSTTTRLLRSADCAKEKGQSKKAARLLSEARKLTQDFYDIAG